jgi:hypothetical protein
MQRPMPVWNGFGQLGSVRRSIEIYRRAARLRGTQLASCFEGGGGGASNRDGGAVVELLTAGVSVG